MIKSILVPVDGSSHAEHAVKLACDLAGKYGASIEFLHVGVEQRVPAELLRAAETEGFGKSPNEALEFLWRRIVEDAESQAREKGITNIRGSVIVGDPATTIVEHVKKFGFDMVVIGSRGMGNIKGLLLGSVSHKVSSLLPCTCVIVR